MYLDTLPRIIKFRHFCFCNTDVQCGKGKHWICFIRSQKSTIELFDSLGVDSEKKLMVENFCKFSTKEIIFNESAFQDLESDTCGKFALYFAIERMHNLDLSFEEILHDLFETDKFRNEEKVQNFCDLALK